jgi:hypothetical protein
MTLEDVVNAIDVIAGVRGARASESYPLESEPETEVR